MYNGIKVNGRLPVMMKLVVVYIFFAHHSLDLACGAKYKCQLLK